MGAGADYEFWWRREAETAALAVEYSDERYSE